MSMTIKYGFNLGENYLQKIAIADRMRNHLNIHVYHVYSDL